MLLEGRARVGKLGMAKSEALHYEARVVLAVTPDALWPLIADTARLNRAIGLPPIHFVVTPDPAGGSRVEGQVRVLGLPLARYVEHPFRWEAPREFVVVRDYHGGPLRRVRAGTRLTPRDGRTEVVIYGDFIPRNVVGQAMVRLALGPLSVRRALAQCRQYEQFLLGTSKWAYPSLTRTRHLPASATGAAAAMVRQGLDERAVELLRQHLAEAPDDEVAKMRPFELADRWGLDRRQILGLFLHATTAGLLVMSWDVLCPNCRVGKAEYGSLRELGQQAHCETCNITFDAAFDRSVEVRFTVAPALRRVDTQEFCIGGPMNTPHVVAQTVLEPGAVDELRCSLKPGSYRLRSPRSRGRLLLEAVASPAESASPASTAAEPLRVTIADDSFEPAVAEVAVGEAHFEIENATARDQLAILETSVWPDTIATAALVSTMQEFRDLFSSEVLAPGLQLGIQNLAFMFTDLSGSTAMYQAIGQARAFRLVQDHFRVLEAAIAANQGALVKTIGDAVMATFASGTDALRAALQIQRDIRDLDAPEGVDTRRLVKVGLHQGPCVAVNLNDRLDYFGTTVNTAARIEHECVGGQIVVSLAACDAPEARKLLDRSEAPLEEDVVRLRGIAEPIPVYRIGPAA